jgi:2,4-dienoyl-CoA reductase-like NADH-dependent reductase (Old Yellow Enzyme family)
MKIFEPISIGNLNLKNRLVMAPLLTNLATAEGQPSEELKEHYGKRAEGGVGLIITEGSCIDSKHRMSKNNLGIFEDRLIPSLKELTKLVHEWDCKIAIQLVHAMGMVDLKVVGTKPSALSPQEIKAIINNFAQAAWRARKADFDAVEFHMAHWYTVADFLSLSGNDRTDRYGRGRIETRAQMAIEILHETRREVGKECPIICRISGDEYVVGGNTLKHTGVISKILVEHGADAIHVSAGNRIEDGGLFGFSSLRGHPNQDMPDAVNIHLAEGIKKFVKVPVVGVGEISSPHMAEEVITQKKADLVALGRALIADPLFPGKAKSMDWQSIRYCQYCNQCWLGVIKGEPLWCRCQNSPLERENA